MPDHVRSVSDMVDEMKKIVEESPTNTSHAKQRQHVVLAIAQLIRSEITSEAQRAHYIADTVGSKPATKTAPMILQLAATAATPATGLKRGEKGTLANLAKKVKK